MTPQPEPLPLPADAASWLQFVDDCTACNLGEARRLIAELKDGTDRTALEVMSRWNDLAMALQAVEAFAEAIANVHPDEVVRSLAEDRNQEFYGLQAERNLDRDLFDVLLAVDPAELDSAAGRVLVHALRDFRRGGVDQPDDVRERLGRIAERGAVLETDFIRGLRDDVRSVRVTPDRLAGLPADFIQSHPPDDDGQVTLTTEYPDLFPVRTYAHDHALRHDLCWQFRNRGWPANEEVLRELLALRAEQARLLGYESWPDYVAEINMVGSAAAVSTFLERLDELARPVARRELDDLLARRRADEPAATGLRGTDQFYYYAELLRRERFGVNAQEVREYFDFPRVKAGLLDVTARMLGLEFREVRDAPVWHSDVTVQDVYSADTGRRLGRIHLDLHPRAGKYGHAALFTLISGVAERCLPEVALVCNFPRGFMTHLDVSTFFHEFGHGLHQIVGGGQEWLHLSGCAEMELDFVETPSQLLEEWTWNADVLRTFALDRSGSPIPADLVQRMRAAEDFGRGLDMVDIVVRGFLAHELYLQAPADPDQLVARLVDRYDIFEDMEGTHRQAGFNHLAEYNCAYYTYGWSLVIAKDLFAAFDPNDLLDAEVGRRYRDRILAPGGSRDAKQLVEDFLGRPHSFEPFRRWLTGVSATVE